MAAFRWMADSYRRCAARLSPNNAWDCLVFSGSLAQRFERLRREVVTRLGEPAWRIASTDEETLRGLLLLARKIKASPGAPG